MLRQAFWYIRIRPRGWTNAVRIYRCYARATLARLYDPKFVTVGAYLNGSMPLEVFVGKAAAEVRPRTEDLGLLALSHEPFVAEWFRPAAGEFVIDAGASVGGYTLRAGARGAKVLAIEPNPETFAVLSKNVKLNSWMKVELECLALGSSRTDAKLSVPPVFSGRASLVHDLKGRNVGVPVDTLDDVSKAHGFRQVDWLKIDVEGSELPLIEGAHETLNRTRRVIIEIEHQNLSRARSVLLGEFGFRIMREDRQAGADYWFLEREPRSFRLHG